ncbi:MAG: hypothetical protein QY304_01470 [Candidatus Paceibacterota bacterium]|nr:MAG: hypothetical protein QY304_01470 [Candidatus Paceibacterota bacterium]
MKKQKGFLKTIILIIIALALLKLVWDFDIVEFINKPFVKAIWETIWSIIGPLWDFIKGLFSVFSKN